MILMVMNNKLEQIMKDKDITSADLSKLTGLTVMTISNARRGKGITLASAQMISEVLGESIETIWPTKNEDEETEAA